MDAIHEVELRLRQASVDVVRVDDRTLRVASPVGPLLVRFDGVFLVTPATADTKVTRIYEDAPAVVAAVRNWK